MNGVEILNTIYEYDSLISPMWGFAFLVATLITVILGICTIDFDNVQRILMILAVFLFFSGLVCICCSTIKTDKIIDTTYQVTVSEDVSMTEFMDKYEVLYQEGKIYVVREKEDVENEMAN